MLIRTSSEPLEGGKMWAWNKRAPAADVIYRPTGVEGEYEVVLAVSGDAKLGRVRR